MRNDSLRTPEKGVILLPENIKSALLAPILFPAAIMKKFSPCIFLLVACAWLAPYRSIGLCAAALCRCIVCACRIFARTLPAYLSASFYVPPACRLRFAKALPVRYHPRFACACRHILSARHLLISAICLHPFEPRRCFPTLGFTHFSCTIFRFMSY